MTGSARVLDCTLRDGGYCNRWRFGFDNIQKIMSGLVESGIDIIECGFLTDGQDYDPDVSKYDSVMNAGKTVPDIRRDKLFAVMVNYGEYRIENLPERGISAVDGIRLAFHKSDMDGALEWGREIERKGYTLFLQPMVSLDYSDREFLELVEKSNVLKPHAFYIVDSFGLMGKKDLLRLFHLVDHNLDDGISIGFHSHNNMQLAYSNAQTLLEMKTGHGMIIDTSIYGMGRGAGNLNTELFVSYLNDNHGGDYKIKPLLGIIDEILDGFYKKERWGYSLPNYLSAAYNTHPDYSNYLSEKNALTIKEMDEILSIMDDGKRACFDREYIEKLYFSYMSAGKAMEQNRSRIESALKNRTVLLIAPGPGSADGREEIDRFRGKEEATAISVNFHYPGADYIFVSNLRRFREIDAALRDRMIVTSNIPADNVFMQTDYGALLNGHEMVRDNAGLMAIAYVMSHGVKEIFLAGYDGYSHDSGSNYGDSRMELVTRNAVLDAMNDGMAAVLGEYGADHEIRFLVGPKNLERKGSMASMREIPRGGGGAPSEKLTYHGGRYAVPLALEAA